VLWKFLPGEVTYKAYRKHEKGNCVPEFNGGDGKGLGQSVVLFFLVGF